MVVSDAFFLSHTSEPVDIPDREEVKAFLPPFDPGDLWLDPENPRTYGSIVMQDAYMEFRYLVQRDMERAKTVVPEVHEEFAGRFGRQYGVVESVQTDDADVVIVCTGTVASTGRVAVETLRNKGKRAGMVKIKALRPFLTEPVIQALRGHAKVAVIDRNISTGGQGVWGQEIKTALYDLPDEERPLIYDYIAGLGGRDISEQTFEEVFDRTLAAERPEDRDIWIGVHYAQPEPAV